MSSSPRVKAADRDWGHDESGCTVLHVDMDAFYASLEVARHPELRGRPVIIGTGPRSVVSAASYEARRYGVNSAMPTSRARRLCPQGVFLPVDMAYYRTVSRAVMEGILGVVTDAVEQVSVDEAYMDVSGALLRWRRPTAIGAWIRRTVAERLSITCSVGVASNKLIAKLASTMAKPDGMLLVPRDRRAEFIGMMPLRSVPGIGPALERRLNSWGVHRVSDLAAIDGDALLRATGSPATARTLALMARGDDDRPVVARRAAKSIGAERTFIRDTKDADAVLGLLRRCCDETASTLRRRGLAARTITVKLRFPDLHYSTRSLTLGSPTDAATTIFPHAAALLRAMLGAGDGPILPTALRLAGVSVSGLSEATSTAVQPSLDDLAGTRRDSEATPAERYGNRGDGGSSKRGDDGATEREGRGMRLRSAEKALDRVRSRYGGDSVRIGL